MKLQQNIILKPYHSFACEEITRFFTTVSTKEALVEAIDWANENNQPYLILGSGTNILFTQQFNGLVIKMEITGIQKLQETASDLLLQVGSGENWSHFVSYCVQKSWGGLENLSLIPGSVGVAPIQNIAAYGVEVSEHIVSVDAFDTINHQWVTIPKQDCGFGYNTSIFKKEPNRYIVCAVQFKLSKQPLLRTDYGAIKSVLHARGISNPSVESIAGAVIYLRSNQWPDPKILGNAGSFFKNPMITTTQYDQLMIQFPTLMAYPINDHTYKIAAGWLIEACGWKGVTKDQVGCYKDQVLVIVNDGATKGKTILDFSEAIIESVKDKFGIVLERSVNIL
jgi:UDP-N-acetylmuramate dehydrogenase